MRVPWAVICESSVVDQETNRVSLFNILEEIQVPEPLDAITEETSLPAAPVNFELFILFSRSDLAVGEQGKGRIQIRFPSDTPVEKSPGLSPEFEIPLTTAHQHRVRIRFPVLPYYSEGTYRFDIEASTSSEAWSHLFEVPLEVSYSR